MHCPLLAACRNSTADDIRSGVPVADVVRAGVAFAADGAVDHRVHRRTPAWVPPAPPAKDIDPLTIELLFTDPGRVRGHITDDEIVEFVRQTVARRATETSRGGNPAPYSVNRICQATGIHHRDVKVIAERIGVVHAFERRTRISSPKHPQKLWELPA
jgi:hypothetical protein